jgi:hypothetical protein
MAAKTIIIKFLPHHSERTFSTAIRAAISASPAAAACGRLQNGLAL